MVPTPVFVGAAPAVADVRAPARRNAIASAPPLPSANPVECPAETPVIAEWPAGVNLAICSARVAHARKTGWHRATAVPNIRHFRIFVCAASAIVSPSNRGPTRHISSVGRLRTAAGNHKNDRTDRAFHVPTVVDHACRDDSRSSACAPSPSQSHCPTLGHKKDSAAEGVRKQKVSAKRQRNTPRLRLAGTTRERPTRPSFRIVSNQLTEFIRLFGFCRRNEDNCKPAYRSVLAPRTCLLQVAFAFETITSGETTWIIGATDVPPIGNERPEFRSNPRYATYCLRIEADFCRESTPPQPDIRRIALVPEARLELARLAAADFESAASTIPPLGHLNSV